MSASNFAKRKRMEQAEDSSPDPSSARASPSLRLISSQKISGGVCMRSPYFHSWKALCFAQRRFNARGTLVLQFFLTSQTLRKTALRQFFGLWCYSSIRTNFFRTETKRMNRPPTASQSLGKHQRKMFLAFRICARPIFSKKERTFFFGVLPSEYSGRWRELRLICF